MGEHQIKSNQFQLVSLEEDHQKYFQIRLEVGMQETESEKTTLEVIQKERITRKGFYLESVSCSAVLEVFLVILKRIETDSCIQTNPYVAFQVGSFEETHQTRSKWVLFTMNLMTLILYYKCNVVSHMAGRGV